MKKTALGFTLIELLVVIIIIGILVAVVNLQIHPLEILSRTRDDVRKVDIHSIANAYETQAVGKNFYEPLILKNFSSGKIPTPPEGGQYQGLLTEPQDYFFICAELEKGKDLNCLLHSENINCYCRKSKNAPTPTPTPIPAPSFSPNPSPSGIGTSNPGPSPTLTPNPSPTPSTAPTPTSTGAPSSCPNPQSKPGNVTLSGIDGSWCYDSDGNGNTGSAGYCMDSCSNTNDFCELNAPSSTARDGYCTGTWWGLFWTNAHCEFGGYDCASTGKVCSGGGICQTEDPSQLKLSVTPSTVIRDSKDFSIKDILTVTWTGIPNPKLGDFINITSLDNKKGLTPHTYWINNNCNWYSPTSGTPKASGSCTIDLSKDFVDTKALDMHLALYNSSSSTDTNIAWLTNSNDIKIVTASGSSIKRVFVSSTTYNGNLGGLVGADGKCQSLANTASLGGSWRAWLSDDTISATNRFNHYGPYKRVDGVIVANDWSDLTDGTLQNKITIDEQGVDRTNYVSAAWTGTGIAGENGYNNCINWTYALPIFQGQIGGINSVISYWTKGASPNYICSSNAALYCFEQ